MYEKNAGAKNPSRQTGLPQLGGLDVACD